MRLGFTSYGAKAALDHLLNTAAWTMPSLSLGLSAGDPGWAGVMTGEPSSGGYGRKALTASMDAVTLATGIAVSNAVVQFAIATGAWGTLTHGFAADASSAGNMVFRGKLVDQRGLGQGFGIVAGSLPITFEAGEIEASILNGYLTDYARKKILDHALGKASYTAANPRLCMFTGNPGQSGSLVTELTGLGYARVALFGKLDATDLATGIARTNATVTFPTASGAWSTAKYIGISDADTAGNLIWFSALRETISVASGDALVFPAGQLAFRLQEAA